MAEKMRALARPDAAAGHRRDGAPGGRGGPAVTATLMATCLAETRRRRCARLQPGARIHMIGVAGAGMNALAAVLLARGYALSGSDHAAQSPQVERLVAPGLTLP